MSLTKKVIALLLTLVMVFAFSSCFGQDEEEEVAVIDIGTVNIGVIYSGDIEEEGSLSQKHHAAFDSARGAAGAGESQINERDNVKVGDKEAFEKTMADLESRGCRLIVTTDEGYYNDIFEYAGKHPSIYFVALADYHEADVKTADNFATISLRTFEADYLEGMLAAANSKTGKIAYVANDEDSTEISAFAVGAKAVNPDSVVIFAQSDDVKSGIEKALATDKCDVVYSKNYIVNEEDGSKFFSVPDSLANDMCVNVLGDEPKFISGASLSLDRMYTKIITDTVNEKFNDVKGYSAGIKEGSVDIRPVDDVALQAKIDAVKTTLYKGEKIAELEMIFVTSSVPYVVAK